LDKKLEFLEVNAARDCYRRYGKFVKPDVNHIKILDLHRNMLREDLGFIKERVDCAMKAGVEVCKLAPLGKVIFEDDLKFVKWLRGFAPKEALESKEFQVIEKRIKDRIPKSVL
ncbi:MAG: hypothetical protein ACRDF4_03310, partial [Rhabdochlamydiaceae bacterium]